MERVSSGKGASDESDVAPDVDAEFASKRRVGWNVRDLFAGLNGESSTREFLTERRQFFQKCQNDSNFEEDERTRAGLLALAIGTLLFLGDDIKRGWDAFIGASRGASDELNRAASVVCETLDPAGFDVGDEPVDSDDLETDDVEEYESRFADENEDDFDF